MPNSGARLAAVPPRGRVRVQVTLDLQAAQSDWLARGTRAVASKLAHPNPVSGVGLGLARRVGNPPICPDFAARAQNRGPWDSRKRRRRVQPRVQI